MYVPNEPKFQLNKIPEFDTTLSAVVNESHAWAGEAVILAVGLGSTVTTTEAVSAHAPPKPAK